MVAVAALLSGCTLLLASSGGSLVTVSSGPFPMFQANNETFHLGAGTFRGPLNIRGNKVTVIGAGIGKTIITGGVRIDGNNNRLERMSVDGPITILGNNNDLRNAALGPGDASVDGNNNRL
jgi:hypothetical protein